MNSHKIEVTREDILLGVPGLLHVSPVAIAIRRAFPNFITTQVIGSVAFCTDAEGEEFVAQLPISAQYAEQAFQNGRVIEPFSFGMREPE